MKTETTSRRLSQLAALTLLLLTAWIVAFQPAARGAFVVAAIVLALTWLTLRPRPTTSTTLWSGDADLRQTRRVTLMVGVAVGIHAFAGIALDLLRRLDATSSIVMSLIVWTLVPAAFLKFGGVRWPKRQGALPKRQLLITGALAFSLAALLSFAVISVAPGRLPSMSPLYLSTVVGSLIVMAAAEEVVFRVLLLTALVDLTRSRIEALVLSGFAFGLVHAPLALLQPVVRADWALLAEAATGYAPVFLMQTALGLLFGALWLRTGSITLIVGTHALINLGNTLAYGL